ncbi:MAG: hypothetical protein M5U12_07740 [Verrucomicrobia bacterium]|nr:hypothetical protein [Verrucomicrobiota bacterium]
MFAAGRGGSSEAREAMADLCRIYWYPLYAYARCQGATADAAQDLTQGFFAHLLAHDLVASADAARGGSGPFCCGAFRTSRPANTPGATRVKRGGDDRCSRWMRRGPSSDSPVNWLIIAIPNGSTNGSGRWP